MNEYDQQALDFLSKHEITFSFKLANTKVPNWKDDSRPVNHFIVTFKKAGKKMSLDFFDSIHNFQKGVTELRAYDALTCCSSELHCPDTFEDFCSEYGYDNDSRSAEKTFRALKKMSDKLQKFFDNQEIRDDLSEIQ
jgi:hypothetical protein